MDKYTEEEKQYLDNTRRYKRSTAMISSKFKSTLLSNRLMALSLSKIGDAMEDEGDIVVQIPGKYIKEAFGSNSNAFFDELDVTAERMTGRTIGWSDPTTQSFEYTAVVSYAKYEDGIFTIEFNKHMREYLKVSTTPYATLNLEVMLNFKSVYSFRLYEILKSKAYTPKGIDNPERKYVFDIDVYEMRLMLGAVNAELESVKAILNKSKGKPDYKKAVEASPEKLFKEWKEFRRNCIEVAVKEINSTPKIDLHVDWEPLKGGRGGRVYALRFFVDMLDKVNENVDESDAEADNEGLDKDNGKEVKLTEDEEFDFVFELKSLFKEYELKKSEILAIAKASNWNMELIKDKKAILDVSGDVEKVAGWMISAIKNNYSTPTRKKKGVKINSVANFKERQYIFDEKGVEIIGEIINGEEKYY